MSQCDFCGERCDDLRERVCWRCAYGLKPGETWEQKRNRNRIHPSRAPARPWRIRVDTGPVGYLWLEWLGACARTAGVAQTAAP